MSRCCLASPLLKKLDIKEIKISVVTVEERLDEMNQRMENGFEAIEKRFGALEVRIDTTESRFCPVLLQDFLPLVRHDLRGGSDWVRR